MKFDDMVYAGQHPGREAAALELLRPLLIHDDFRPAAVEFLSLLARSLGCERASLGFFDGKAVRLSAVSEHYAGIRHPVLPEVAAAMEESLLQDTALALPQATGTFPYILVAHAELLRHNSLSSALTLPLAQDGELIGAITLESRRPQAADPAQLPMLEQLIAHAAPLLKLKWSLQRPLAARCMDTLRRQAKVRRARIVLAAGGILAVALLFLLPASNQVSGQARLEASVQRVISAPIDGYLKEVRVRPGDRVQARQPLAEVNDDSLRSEARKLEAEAVQQDNALAEAMVKGDRTQVALRRARLDEILAQKDLVMQQLERTQLLAPFDGVVIKGDLTQLLGSPMKRGDVLFTLSQGPEFRVIVEVPERDIEDIRLGQHGKLVLSALPSQQFPIRIKRITPVANVSADGKNVFEVEATLDANAPALVPGLKGVAKIAAGSRPLGWQWLGRAWQQLSFLLWSRLG